MSKHLLYTFLLVLLILGCAKPNSKPDSQKTSNLNSSENAGCKISLRKDPNICLNWYWDTLAKPEEEFGSLKVFFVDTNVFTKLIKLESLVLWMPSMGHGSSPTEVTNLGDGFFKVTNIWFIMKQDWELRFTVQLDDGTREEVSDYIYFN